MLRSRDCHDSFTADACSNFSPRTSCAKHKRHDKGEPGLFKEDFDALKRCVCVARLSDVTILGATSLNSAARA